LSQTPATPAVAGATRAEYTACRWWDDWRTTGLGQVAHPQARRLLHPDSRKFYVGCTYAEGARSAVIIASI